ncbi:F-box/LRR-repeat protein [Senna tora]|uniref:F-box/LRR-repeat protein n=1 Tax=Senna tora TaxID=362788 RepID=A0A835C9B9_9FABA|nr:F-box/LRR-repeat protein [Senna tora]
MQRNNPPEMEAAPPDGDGGAGMINRFNDDVIQNILARLPAATFAAAACVSKKWNRISRQILCRPKLVSALSRNPSLINAMSEVLDKVLSKPIRPHFAIAFISEQYGLKLAHYLITRKLGRKIPLVIHISHGVMGKDTATNSLREVKWNYFDYSGRHPGESNAHCNRNEGLVLVVGFVPGLRDLDAYKFVRDIKAYTANASGSESPSAIIMFGDRKSSGHMNSVVATMDHAFAKETAIVGDAGGCFMFNSLNYKITCPAGSYVLDAVALASDPYSELFIAASQERRWGESLVLYRLIAGERMELMVQGVGIQPGDSFLFYHRDMETAHTTLTVAYDNLHMLKGDDSSEEEDEEEDEDEDEEDEDEYEYEDEDEDEDEEMEEVKDINDKCGRVFGGLIFSCGDRGESYFGEANVDMIPFTENFPKVDIAGSFCKGEIGRGSSSVIRESEGQEQCPAFCSLHARSAVYLAFSYIPPPPTQQQE